VINLDERKILQGSTSPLALAKIFATRMLTRDLFAVADILIQWRLKSVTKIIVIYIGQPWDSQPPSPSVRSTISSCTLLVFHHVSNTNTSPTIRARRHKASAARREVNSNQCRRGWSFVQHEADTVSRSSEELSSLPKTEYIQILGYACLISTWTCN